MHSHNYDHSHQHKYDNKESRSILVAFLLNITFVIIELIGGFYSNSVSIISDAIHDLGDSISLLITFVLSILANKGRDDHYTFGYKRILVVGALMNSAILFIGSIYVYWQSIQRFIHPEEVNAKIMFYVAILGIVVNGISVYKMSNNRSLMSKSVMLHLIEDLLGWIAVFISSIVIYFFNINRVDDVLSFIIATIILINAVKTLRKAFEILLQKVPKDIDIHEVETIIKGFKHVVDVHDIHIWTLDGEDVIFTCHVVVDDGISQMDSTILKARIKMKLEQKLINHATLEFETLKEADYHGDMEL